MGMYAPDPPNPYATAAAQGTINKDAAISTSELNAINQKTPQGTLNYSQNGSWADGTPKLQVEQSLSPDQQKLYDLGTQTQTNLANIGVSQSDKLGGILNSNFSLSPDAIAQQSQGMPQAPQYAPAQGMYGSSSDHYNYMSGADLQQLHDISGNVGPNAPSARYTNAGNYATDPTAYQTTAPNKVNSRYDSAPTQVQTRQIGSNDSLENQLYSAAFKRYQPQLNDQKQQLESDLANKGLTVGSTAYESAMRGYDNSVNDLKSQTFLNGQNQAFQQSAARAQNDFGQDLQSNNQYFTQADTANQHNFGQDLSATQADFQNRLSANGQNFNQVLGANNQNFSHDLAANAQNYGQDMTNAQYGMQQDATRFANTGADLNATNQAQNSAFTQGMAGDQFNIAQQQANYGYQMNQRQQALNELTAQRQEPLNEISALMGGSQVSKPSWTATPTSTIQPANLEGLVTNNYNQQVSQGNALLGGLAGLGGSILKGGFSPGGFLTSDIRLKQGVVEVGTDPATGHTVYTYQYKPEAGLGDAVHIGVMAQDVAERQPDAVALMPNGFLAVDYSKALGGVH